MRRVAVVAVAACLAVVAVASAGQAAERRKLNLTVPLILYSAGSGADIWSTRKPPTGYRYTDRSFAGPAAGPAITGLCFGGADVLLQRSGHRGWAKVLRVGYGVGVVAVVVHNKGMEKGER